MVGSEVRLQLDHDVYVSELYFQPVREQESEFDLNGLLGDPVNTTLNADWFATPDLDTLTELVLTNQPEGTSPTGRVIFSADTDADGLPDAWETENGLDTAADDSQDDGDGDGLSNELEFYLSTALDNTDTDADGLTDGDEFATYGSSPSSTDSDRDGLTDGDEVNKHFTSPILADTDSDGLSDGDEINTHATDPTKADSDGDGVNDQLELAAGADPLDPESRVGAWQVRLVNSSIALGNLATAEAALAGTGIASEISSQHLTINFAPDGGGNFDNNEIFPNMTEAGQDLNDFVIEVTGKFSVPSDGLYTLGFNTDDGGSLEVNGEELVAFPGTRGAANSLGSLQLAAGEHDLRFVMFERTGGSAAELYIANAPGELTEFSLDQFQLLPAAVSDVVTPPIGDLLPLIGVTRNADGSLAIGIPAGATYDIEYSSDLQSWTPLATGQSNVYTDNDPTRTADTPGFYRGVRP